MEIKEAMAKITTELKNDTGYRKSWKANIAMAYKDCEHWYKQKTEQIDKNEWLGYSEAILFSTGYLLL